tara:strand:- start:1460 stop:1858 length:399 start_codon:yes stop_codon:yes gene_type:complete
MYLFHYCKKINDFLFDEKIEKKHLQFIINKFNLQSKDEYKEYWDKNVKILANQGVLIYNYINDISVYYRDDYLINEFEIEKCVHYNFYNVDSEENYTLYENEIDSVKYILKVYDTYLSFSYESEKVINIKLF